MLSRLCGRVLAAAALMLAAWSIGASPDSGADGGIPSIGGPHRQVRILRFYATTASILRGDTAELCYGVANAKSVRISPSLDPVAPAAYRCFEVVPDHTTHYTILAEGFDGQVVSKVVTLIVETTPAPQHSQTYIAGAGFRRRLTSIWAS